jgi:hypothetical protein
MTTVEILYRYAAQPSESVLFALSAAREVYGIRKLTFDREAQTVRIEYDSTRLNSATVTNLVRRAGLDIVEELPLIPPPPPEPETALEPAKA